MAIKQNKYECIKFLVERGAKINLPNPEFEEVSPLFFAIRINNLKALEVICDTGVSIDKIISTKGYDPIHYACSI